MACAALTPVIPTPVAWHIGVAGSAGSPSDGVLVSRLAAGDDAALGALYDRHGATLYALAFRILADRDDAEEVVMDAMTQAWRASGTYSADRGSVAAWLVVLTRSRALDHLRSRHRQARALDRAAALETDGALAMGDQASDAGAAAEHGERRARIRAALASLPEPQRVCIELAYYQGLTQTEIAAQLGEPLGTVKTRMRLGLLKLRDTLQPLLVEMLA